MYELSLSLEKKKEFLLNKMRNRENVHWLLKIFQKNHALSVLVISAKLQKVKVENTEQSNTYEVKATKI